MGHTGAEMKTMNAVVQAAQALTRIADSLAALTGTDDLTRERDTSREAGQHARDRILELEAENAALRRRLHQLEAEAT